MRVLLVRVVVFAVTLFIASGVAGAAGPWKIQVVDAETKQPLEGVVIVIAWYRDRGHNLPYLDSDEVVTGRDGRAVVKARQLRPIGVVGPYLDLFKSGYSTVWRFQGSDQWGQYEFWKRDDAWKEITRKGVVLELPPLKTREERRKALPGLPRVPWSLMPRYMEALNQERVDLGLSPYRVPPREEKE